LGDGPIRLIHVDPSERIFVVSGTGMYLLTESSGSWASEQIGTLGTATGRVRAASSEFHTVFCDGSTNNYAFVNSTEDFDTFSDLSLSGVQNATFVVYIDGYFIFSGDGTNKFYTSDVSSLNVSPL